jgi:thiol-disulfide isomerase/thioredoxin
MAMVPSEAVMRYTATLGIGLILLASSFAQPSPEVANLVKRGDAELQAKNYKDAFRDYGEGNRLAGGNCEPCFEGLALSKAGMGNEKEALKLIDKGLGVASTAEERASAHARRGDILTIFGLNDPARMRQAEAEYRLELAETPNSAEGHFNLGYALMRQQKTAEGTDELRKFVAASPDGAMADVARKLIGNPNRARQELTPKFSFITTNGTRIDNSEVMGKIVVFDFWASWCVPCKRSLPSLRDLHARYPADQLVVVSISIDDDAAKWQQAVQQEKMDWLQYRDANGKLRSLFGVSTIPHFIVINREGAIENHIIGYKEDDPIAEQLHAELTSMLK